MVKKLGSRTAIVFFSLFFISTLFSQSESDYAILSKMKAFASSVLIEAGKNKNMYLPEKAVDGKIDTFWCEGKEDDGVGETLELKFNPSLVEGIRIGNGVLLNQKYHSLNNRIKNYEITYLLLNGKSKVVSGVFSDTSCSDSCREQNLDGKALQECQLENKNKCLFERIGEDTFAGGNSIEFNGEFQCLIGIQLKIRSVYPGKKFKDTCVSEIRFKTPLSFESEGKNKELQMLKQSCK